jgi:hypothetical protein
MTAKLRKNKILGSKWLTADCVPEVTAYFSKIPWHRHIKIEIQVLPWSRHKNVAAFNWLM